MYPQWLEEICRTPCKCHGVPSTDDIVGIGVAKPGKGAEFMGPMAMVMVVCPNCGELMNITVREPLKSIIAAMRQLVEIIDEVGRKTPPPFNLSRPKPKPTGDGANVNSPGPLRPSLRKDQPTTPPTQREIQSFLHRLRKASFRSGSKGFNEWMKDIGGDPGADDDPPNNEDQTN